MQLKELLNAETELNKAENVGFFTDENPDGYTSKKDLIDYLKSQKQKGGPKNWRIIHIVNFFNNAKKGYRLARIPEPIWDNGEKWIWCKFSIGKVSQNLKIADGGGMHQLITDYALGKTKINYNLEDLLNQTTES